MAMKQTLLEMTQAILASMQGDAVTSISDTEESTAVALIIKENYFYITGKADLPEHKELFTLTETSASTPVIMTPPSSFTTLEWLKYNNIMDTETDNNFQFVNYMNSKDFLTMQNGLNSDESVVDTMDYTIGSNTFSFKFHNNMMPTWYTTWNDNTIIFNAYDATEESFLRTTKTLAYGLLDPVWTHSDSFTPDLDNRQFTLLLNESKAQCFAELKQAQNVNAERKIRHGWVELSRTKNNLPDKVSAYSKIPGFGRKRK
jgi:hypothetical protein